MQTHACCSSNRTHIICTRNGRAQPYHFCEMDVVHQDLTQEPTVIYPTNFADKASYLENARDTIFRYRNSIIGRSTRTPSRLQKHAMAEIYNSTGLWSGHWARHLRPAPVGHLILQDVEQVVTLPPPQSAISDA